MNASGNPPDLPPGAPDGAPSTAPDDSGTVLDPVVGAVAAGTRPVVPDHELLRPIGRGAYGEVWLARNIMGTYRAVKVVWRTAFQREKPFEREFKGIQRFEPISRSHPGLVDILQVGRTDACFYYVMELADDVATGQEINPELYVPRTLRKELEARGRLPVERCVEVGLALASGLHHLHAHGLIHRDIKPSNLIFVHGQPKLADIGLVAEASEAKSFVGTEGFIPPEGPGTASADVYSLGKVLYEMATGKDRHDFPELPETVGGSGVGSLLELNAVILKACQSEVRRRYGTAEALRQDLLLLQSGRSVTWTQALERRLRRLMQALVVGIMVILVAVLAGVFFQRQAASEAALRARAEDGEQQARRYLYVADISRAFEALRNGNLAWARELRDRHRGPEEAANWEWRYLWKETKGDDLFILGRHSPIAQVALWMGDGRRALSGGSDGLLKLWDVGPRARIEQWDLGDRVNGLAMSADGRRFATGLSNGKLTMWDAESLERIWSVTHPHPIGQLALSPDGRYLAAAGGERVSVVDPMNGGILRAVTNDHDAVYHWKVPLAFSPDSRVLSYSGIGERYYALDLETGEVSSWPKSGRNQSIAMAFAPDGRTLVTGDDDPAISVWDFPARQRLTTLNGHRGHIVCVAFSADGRRLATGSGDQTIRVWDTTSWRETAILRGHDIEVWSASFSPDGTRLLSAAKDGTVRVWPTDLSVDRKSIPPPVSNAVWSVHTERAAPQPRLTLWSPGEAFSLDLRSGEEVFRSPIIKGLDRGQTAFDVLPGYRLVVGFGDGRCAMWEALTGRDVWSVMLRSNAVTAVEHLAGPDEILVAFEDGALARLGCATGNQLSLWRVAASAEPGGTAPPGRGPVVLAADPHARRIFFSTGRHGEEVLIDRESGVMSPFRHDHRESVIAARFSADGRWILTMSYDPQAVLRDVESGRVMARFKGQLAGFASGAVSPDGRRVALGGGDDSLSVWDVATSQQIGSLAEGRLSVRHLDWSSDGETLTSVDAQGGLQFWRAAAPADIERLVNEPTRRGGRSL